MEEGAGASLKAFFWRLGWVSILSEGPEPLSCGSPFSWGGWKLPPSSWMGLPEAGAPLPHGCCDLAPRHGAVR